MTDTTALPHSNPLADGRAFRSPRIGVAPFCNAHLRHPAAPGAAPALTLLKVSVFIYNQEFAHAAPGGTRHGTRSKQHRSYVFSYVFLQCALAAPGCTRCGTRCNSEQSICFYILDGTAHPIPLLSYILLIKAGVWDGAAVAGLAARCVLEF